MGGGAVGTAQRACGSAGDRGGGAPDANRGGQRPSVAPPQRRLLRGWIPVRVRLRTLCACGTHACRTYNIVYMRAVLCRRGPCFVAECFMRRYQTL